MDIFSTLVEAVLVLIISSLSLMILSIQFGLNNKDIGFFEAISNTLQVALHPTESIIYVTGILSSTTAYFLLRLTHVRKHIVSNCNNICYYIFNVFLRHPVIYFGTGRHPNKPNFCSCVVHHIRDCGCSDLDVFTIFSTSYIRTTSYTYKLRRSRKANSSKSRGNL